ncbi:fluoride efflux transporter FluC [Leucobacter sp. HNU]|uniref:fluoride efflux transporter FluC n=1 Tax=Leucobacter sp. HNU TaxID=3236805 RepID=UPI003A810D73
MTPLLLLGVALAGGIGAVARFSFDWAMQPLLRRRERSGSRGFPWATLLINVSGSLVLGALAALAGLAGGPQTLPPEWFAILGTGFLGGYTTFSTASVDAARLIAARRWNAALGYAGGTAVLSSLAAAAGFWAPAILV